MLGIFLVSLKYKAGDVASLIYWAKFQASEWEVLS